MPSSRPAFPGSFREEREVETVAVRHTAFSGPGETVTPQDAAIARGKDKEPLARQLGAAHHIDSQAADPAAELAKLGGAKVVLATVTHGPAMSATVGGLAPRGRLMVLGAAESLETSPFLLIGGRRSVQGWYSGTSIDSEDAGVQRLVRCPFDERSVPPGTGGRGLRPHDGRQGALPGRAGDVKPGGLNDAPCRFPARVVVIEIVAAKA